jgi:hypothetical protein
MLRQRISRQRLALSWADGGSAEEHYLAFRQALADLQEPASQSADSERRTAVGS